MVFHVFNVFIMKRNPFNLPSHVVYNDCESPIDNNPAICEGADIYDVLCPVSKLSGVRENPLLLLSRVLSPDKARYIDMILQELPNIPTNQDISDDDALDMVVSRLNIGSPAEDDAVRVQLSRVVDVLLPQRAVEVPKPADKPSIDNVLDNV